VSEFYFNHATFDMKDGTECWALS